MQTILSILFLLLMPFCVSTLSDMHKPGAPSATHRFWWFLKDSFFKFVAWPLLFAVLVWEPLTPNISMRKLWAVAAWAFFGINGIRLLTDEGWGWCIRAFLIGTLAWLVIDIVVFTIFSSSASAEESGE